MDQLPTLSPAQREELEATDEETLPPADERRIELPAWGLWLEVPEDDRGNPARHRVARGGRGGAKSRTIARKLLLMGAAKVHRVLCAREFQKSIRDSVKRLLDDEIERLGLGKRGNGFYHSTDKEIRGRNGTLFVFHGLHRNENGIKSLEGITIAWVEEAQVASKDSVEALIPTIRAPGSEIWWSYNPKFPTDYVDQLFYGDELPPPGTILIEVHHQDNPWFPDVLRAEMEYDQRRDPDKYQHIWQGQYLQRSEAKVFRNWRIMEFETPADAVMRFGADWGFSIDPTVLVRSFIGRWEGEPWESAPIPDPDGNVLFVDHERWALHLGIDQTPAFFAGSDRWTAPGKERWSNPRGYEGIPGAAMWKIIADSARPEIIAYMAERGFAIEPARKGAGSVEEGVTFLQSYDICVHPRCRHVIDELTHYAWKEDKKTGEIFPQLADKHNHTIDALRYSLEAVRLAGDGKFHAASSGRRAIAGQGAGKKGADQIAKTFSSSADASDEDNGGAGWGSSPGLRGGL